MSEGADDEDKKHDPSERRLREAAERGELPRSPEVSAVAATLAAAAALLLGAASVVAPIHGFATLALDPATRLDAGGADLLLREGLATVARAAAPPLLAGAGAALVVGLAQSRFELASRAFEARAENLDPIGTAQRVWFSKQPLVELAKGMLHVGALGAVAFSAIRDRLDELPRLATVPASALPLVLSDLASSLLGRAVPVMVALAVVDGAWTWWRWWESMRMTDQQARDEHKESEGDPHVKAQRRRMQASLRRASRQLAEADVLVTNPTHYAIGIRYRHGTDPAPIVVVKGVDALALRLREEAGKLGIPRIEDRALARALHAQVPRGKAVPAALYGPVARVLAVVYRRRGKKLSKVTRRAGARSGRAAR